jgi:rhamnogalacturonyl hydrolase YesR
MFTYVCARGVNGRYLPPEYSRYAWTGWQGVRSRIRADGQIEGICAGTVVSDDPADYYARPTPLDDPHGIGALLLAGAEMEKLAKRGE